MASKLLVRVTQAPKKIALSGLQKLRVRPRTVLYEAYSGAGLLCSPEAIFRELLAAPDQSDMRHVWAIEDPHELARLRAVFRHESRVSFVRSGTLSYYRALATCQFLVNNSTFPAAFTKRGGQIYLNTWHGTPLKAMGYDVPGGGPETRNIIRNFLAADFLLSANPFMTQVMYRDAYRLDGIFRGTILEEGAPRTDWDFLARPEALKRLTSAGLQDGPSASDRILLVAPTWRGESFYEPVDDSDELAELADRIQNSVAGLGWRVLLKVHQRSYPMARANPRVAPYLVPGGVPANVVLAAADALVTDYSSIFYDFLPTGRPIIFYEPDLDAFSGYRGMYRDTATLPGPVTHRVEDLVALLAHLGTGDNHDPERTHAAARARDKDEYCPWDDGHCAQRVVDAVFRGNAGAYRRERDFHVGRKPSLLIHAGGMLPNGITSSALNLIRRLDYDRFDISVTYPHRANPAHLAQVAQIDHRARLLPRLGQFLSPVVGLGLLASRGPAGGIDPTSAKARRAFEAEYSRCFGSATFDYVVDFSGYAPAWAGIFAFSPGASRRAIWQHNDLAAERNKRVAGKYPHRNTLARVFELYPQFDAIVAVSEALAAVNAANLADYAPAEKFTAVPNVIDGERMERLAAVPLGEVSVAPLAEEGEAAKLQRTRELERGLERIESWHDSGDYIVAWMGRLSPEKNPLRLIEAFALAKSQATEGCLRLVMIGSGPLDLQVKALINARGLVDDVIMLGQVANPFPVLRASDCFVLSSNHEGQPMVILEARLMGLPVISTRFSSVESALPEGTGLIVDKDDDALAKGMLLAAEGRVPAPPFDWHAYNAGALTAFYRAVIGPGAL